MDCQWNGVTFYRVPTNEPWCRDQRADFLTRGADPRLAIADWDYNAWAGNIRRARSR